MTAMKKLTFFVAINWILILCMYSIGILGSLYHELQHYENSINPLALEVHYDTSGKMYAKDFLPHSHLMIYFKEFLLILYLSIITTIALIIIIKS